MSYAQLKAFHAVATEGTIQKAARRLNLTQPAISLHLKKLQSDTGKILFRRTGHRFELNGDGRALLEAVNRMVRAEQDAGKILSPNRGGHKGSLVVGADGPHVALEVIELFRKQTPSVQITAVLSNASDTWSNLLDLKVDVAMLAGSPEDHRVSKQSVMHQGLVALVPRHHALADTQSIDLRTLKGQPIIFREEGSSTQVIVEEHFLREKIVVDPSLILGSREAVFTAVARGMGIGFAYEREAGQDANIVAIPVAGLDLASQDEVVCLKTQKNVPLVTRFIACAMALRNEDGK